jgi:hypothetical protein
MQRRYIDGRPVWGLNGVRRVPYRLPELLEARRMGCDVFITEGENDADSVGSLGLTATSLKFWKPEMNHFLKGLNLTVLRDHDAPGVKQAAAFAQEILSVASVKVVDLFEGEPLPAKDGKDVTNWIEERRASGFDNDSVAEELSRIAEASPSPETPSAVRSIGLTFGELLSMEIPPRQEVIYGLARREVGLLCAVTNIGKTTMLRNLTVSLAIGRSFVPFIESPLPKRIAFLDFEDTLASLRKDFLTMLSTCSEQDRARFNDNVLLICEVRNAFDEDLSLSKIDDIHLVTENLAKFKPDIIFCDTAASAFQIRNENDNAEVRSHIMRPLKNIAQDVDAALLVTHHIGKAKSEDGVTREAAHRGRGASSFSDMAKMVLNLERDNVDETVILNCAKVKGPKFTDLKFKLNQNTRWFYSAGECRKATNYTLVVEMFDDGEPHDTADVIAEFDAIPERSVKEILRKALENNDLEKIRHGCYQKPAERTQCAKVQTV